MLPALIPLVVTEIGVAPAPAGVTVTPVGAVVVVLPAASVVVTPPLDTTVELPAASEIVEEPPVTVCVLPEPSVYVADVKPVKAFAILMFNVPDVVSPTTAILPDVRSVAVVDAPPLMLSCSPCLRLITVASSPAKLCLASSKACFVLSMAEFTTDATFCVVATPSLPCTAPCEAPAAPILPVVSSITSLPSSTLTVYVLTPAAVASLTVARPVPATFTASWASVLTLSEPVVDKLDKSLSADFSAAVTAFCNFVLVPTVIVSPDTVVVTSAFVPLSPTTLSLPVLILTEPSVVPSLMVNVEEIPANASSICFLLTAASSVVPFLTPLIS